MIAIGDRPLDLADIRAALGGPIRVSLPEAARARILRSAETVKRLLATGDAIYGVNTGFGKLAKTRIAAADLDRLQVNIVRSHAAGVGAPLEQGVTRLILLMKLNALAQGASGISLAAMEALAALINAGADVNIQNKERCALFGRAAGGASAAAGAAGALLRAGCTTLANRLWGVGFPWGTLAVNVAGSLAFGLLVGLARTRGTITVGLETILLIGLMGGFTTFSSYAFQSMEMLTGGRAVQAVAYVVVTNVAALVAVWLGLRIAGGE